MSAASASRFGYAVATIASIWLGVAVATYAHGLTRVAVALLFVGTAWLVAVLWRSRGEIDVLDPLFAWAAPFWMLTLLGSSNVGHLFGIEIGETQWLVYAAAFLFFIFGSAGGALLAEMMPVRLKAPSEPPWNAVTSRRNLVFVLGILAVAWSFSSAGIPLLGSVDTARFSYQSPLGGLWGYVLRMMLAAGMASAVILSSRIAPVSKRWGSALVALASTAILVANGSRVFVVPILVSLLVGAGFLRRRLRPAAALITAALLISALSLFSAYRSSTEYGGEAALALQLSALGVPPSFSFLGSAFLSFQVAPHMLARAVQLVPTMIPFQQGRVLLGEALTLLPGSQMLPDQWIALNIAGTIPAQLTGGVVYPGQGGGVPPGILGGFYIDFGLSGVLIGMALVGAILAFAYTRAKANPTLLSVVIYASVLTYFLISIYGFVTLKLPYVAELAVLTYIFWPARGVVASQLRNEPAVDNV